MSERRLFRETEESDADGQRATDLGARISVYVAGHLDGNCRCQAHACGGDMLGELYAVAEILAVFAECQPLPRAYC